MQILISTSAERPKKAAKPALRFKAPKQYMHTELVSNSRDVLYLKTDTPVKVSFVTAVRAMFEEASAQLQYAATENSSIPAAPNTQQFRAAVSGRVEVVDGGTYTSYGAHYTARFRLLVGGNAVKNLKFNNKTGVDAFLEAYKAIVRQFVAMLGASHLYENQSYVLLGSPQGTYQLTFAFGTNYDTIAFATH